MLDRVPLPEKIKCLTINCQKVGLGKPSPHVLLIPKLGLSVPHKPSFVAQHTIDKGAVSCFLVPPSYPASLPLIPVTTCINLDFILFLLSISIDWCDWPAVSVHSTFPLNGPANTAHLDVSKPFGPAQESPYLVPSTIPLHPSGAL